MLRRGMGTSGRHLTASGVQQVCYLLEPRAHRRYSFHLDWRVPEEKLRGMECAGGLSWRVEVQPAPYRLGDLSDRGIGLRLSFCRITGLRR